MCTAMRVLKARYGGTEPTVEVPCRKWPDCRKEWLNDIIGRCSAEALVSDYAYVAHLTYREGEQGAYELLYSDIQNWMKRLRKSGHKVRYLVAGEQGSRNGRCHWHVIIFGRGEPPKVKLDGREYDDEWWPHGLVMWQKAHSSSIAYAAKYITKDYDGAVKFAAAHRKQSFHEMSRKPPLGTEYFKRMAEDAVKAGLPPHPTYVLDWIDRKGNRRFWKYWIRDSAKDHYLEHFVKCWQEAYPGRFLPSSDYLAGWLDLLGGTIEENRPIEELLARRRQEQRLWWLKREAAKAAKRAEALGKYVDEEEDEGWNPDVF